MVQDVSGDSVYRKLPTPFLRPKNLGLLLGKKPVWFSPRQYPALSGRKAEMSQRGWLTKEERKRAGKVWVYHYYRTRDTDGHRVENTVVVGALSSLLREKDAWAEVEHRRCVSTRMRHTA